MALLKDEVDDRNNEVSIDEVSTAEYDGAINKLLLHKTVSISQRFS